MLPFSQSIKTRQAFILVLPLQIFQDPQKLSDHHTEDLTHILILAVVLIIHQFCLFNHIIISFLVAVCRQLLQCAET